MNETGPAAASSMKEINAGFDALERTIRRESAWLPGIVSAVYGLSMGLVIWGGFTGEGWNVISHVIVIAFAVMMTWFYWDVDARRRVAVLKYQTAAGLLDHLVEEYDWKWEPCEEAGSVSLHAPEAHKDDDDEDTEDAEK